jgi:AcrR family transcriptional regulator
VPLSNDERARIREALLDLCLERGYASLELSLLLARAGVDERAFRRHFADLEDCLCGVYLEIRDDFFARVELAIAAQPTWRDRLRAAAYAFLRFLRDDERVTHLSVIEVRMAGERPQLLFGEAFNRLMDLLDEGRVERADPDSITRATAEGVGARIFSQIDEAVENGRLDLGDEAIPELMYAAVFPYLGVAPATEELRIPPPRWPPRTPPPDRRRAPG